VSNITPIYVRFWVAKVRRIFQSAKLFTLFF